MSIEGQGHFLTLAQYRVHTKIQSGFSQKLLCQSEPILAHLSRRLKGELIVYQSSGRPSVCASVNIFKLDYLRNQWSNRNEILSEPSLGWGISCIRGFGPHRIGTLVSMATDSSHRVIMGKMW